MNIFNFIIWWWKELSTPARVVLAFVGWFLPHMIWMALGGNATAGLSFLISGALILLIIISYLIISAILFQWIRYKNYVAFEEEQTVAALKGDPIRKNPYSHRGEWNR